MVFCFPKKEIQEKALTLGGAIVFQKQDNGTLRIGEIGIVKIEKKDLEENTSL